MGYFFIINEKTQSIEGYSKKKTTAVVTLKRKQKQNPDVEYTLRVATFGEPLNLELLDIWCNDN